MSETNVIETGQTAAPKQGDDYTVSIVSLLTNGNSEKAISEAIDNLIERRVNWEKNELMSANDALYGLLQHCLALNNAMVGADSISKNLRKGLGNYIEQKGYKFTDSTPLISKIVRCVFGVDRRRVNAYSTAMRAAMSERISVLELPKFFRDAGGVEEVRRKVAKPAKTMKQKVALGRTVLDSEAIASIKSDSLSAVYATDNTETGVVLLATREDDGSFAVRRVVQSQSAVNSALAACSSVGAEKEKARLIQEEQDAVEAQRAAARAALKAA
jgi:hypothetical protein